MGHQLSALLGLTFSDQELVGDPAGGCRLNFGKLRALSILLLVVSGDLVQILEFVLLPFVVC